MDFNIRQSLPTDYNRRVAHSRWLLGINFSALYFEMYNIGKINLSDAALCYSFTLHFSELFASRDSMPGLDTNSEIKDSTHKLCHFGCATPLPSFQTG